MPIARTIAARHRRSAAPGGVSPAVERSVLQDVASLAGGTVGALGYALDTPGSLFRGALASDVGSAFGTAEERIDGRELLRKYGLVKEEDDWVNWGLGLATEIALDPLAIVSGPLTALTSAGKAARAAGLMPQAARAASRAFVDDAAKVAPEISERATAGMKRLTQGGRRYTQNDLYSKPLVGQRAATKFTTLDDVVRYADDPARAEDDVVRFLGNGDAAAGKVAFDKLRNQRLSGDIGLGLPFQDAAVTFDLGGLGTAYRDALDTAGRAVRWSTPGRLGAALFSKPVGGAVDAETQMINAARTARSGQSRAKRMRESARWVSRLRSEAPDVFSDDGNRMLGRLIEGNTETDDLRYWAKNPVVREYMEWWDEVSQDVLEESKALGMGSGELQDPFGLMYLPYQADSMFEMASQNNPKLRRGLSFLTGDQLRRTKAMRTPGGRDQIMRLSQDANVSGPGRALKTDAAAAAYLARTVFGAPLNTLPRAQQKNVTRLARILHRLPKEATDIAPLFGQHPAQMIQQYLTGRADAAGTLDTVLDSLVTFASRQKATHVTGGEHVTMAEALRQLGTREGAKEQMRERLAAAMGTNPNKINLNTISLPREHVQRLTRAQKGFADPPASNEVTKWLDSYTNVWKGSILAWPSRIVRDLYSGAYANWLAGAFSMRAAGAAKTLLEHSADSPQFAEYLAALPQYSSIASPVERAAAFNADLAATELLSGGALLDRTTTVTGDALLRQIPGAEPATFSGAVSELTNLSGYKPENFLSFPTPGQPYRPTRNPILRAGDKANTVSDGINRLTGYYALLEQGYSPSAAADQIKRVQVDYGSLSDFERDWMKRVFPWYTYQSRIFGEVVQQLAQRPGGRYAQGLRVASRSQQDASDDSYIPSYLREQIALPVGELPTGQLYLSDIDLPGFDQLNMLELPGTGRDPFLESARQVAEQLSPQYRMGVEFLTGRDLYYDRPITESSGVASTISRRLTGGPMPYGYVADRVIGNIPFVQRPVTAISKLFDERSGLSLPARAATTAIDQLSGVKVRAVGQDSIERDIDRLLQASIDTLPQARTMTRTYVPDELQGSLPQWAIDRMEYQSELARRRRARQAQ